jgi:hypothetical protein
MSSCQLYQVHCETLRSSEINGSRQAAVILVRTPYCEHAHSPMPKPAICTVGAGARFQCEGDLDRCQVLPEHRGSR